jgi:DNA polymerase-3 subunit delta
MPAENIQEFTKIIQDLKSGKRAPFYLLHGEETYFIDEIASFIEQNVLNEMEKAFNQHVFYAKDVEVGQVIEAARRFPMMAEHQVIIVKEAQNWRQIEDLVAYVEHPVPSTIMVICYKGKKVDGRGKLIKSSKKFVSFEAKKLYEETELPKWIINLVKTKGFSIDDQNAILIADFIGNDLNRINNELEKLIINKGQDKQITQQDIENFIGISKEFNTFELIKAIAQKNARKVFHINHHLSGKKDFSIIPFLAVLNGYISKAYDLKQRGIRDQKSIMSSGVNFMQAKDYESLLQHYSLNALFSILGLIASFDLRSKGVDQNSLSDEELMKELLFMVLAQN